MAGLINDIEIAFNSFSWTNLFEVMAIAVVLYAGLRLLRGTTAMSVIRGMVFVVVLISVLGRVVDSVVLDWIVDNALAVLLIVVLLVFQPEFRRAFEHVGRAGGFRLWGTRRQPYRVLIPMVSAVAHRLSQQGSGGLFVFERDTGFGELAADGVRLGAAPTTGLLESIFWRGSPLHDGAVLLRPSEVVAAAVILPTATSDFALRETATGQHLGTRHRAALTVTEDTDAIAVVVSEESGGISLAVGGELIGPLTTAELESALDRHLHTRRYGDRFGVRLPSANSNQRPSTPSATGGDATGS